MRWLLAVPLLPLIACGVICFGGLAVAFVLGRLSAKGQDAAPSPERQDVS